MDPAQPHRHGAPAARVLQVVLSLHPGGTERLVVELARRLHAELPMAVCCLDEAGAWASELAAAGIAVTALGRTPGFHPGLGRGVAAAADAHGATVLHAHHYSPFVYAAIARLRGTHRRVIFTEHGRLSDAGPSPKRRMANRLLRAAASRVFAVSNDVGRHLVAEGFRADQVGVIYNGIDTGALPAPDDRNRVRAALGVSANTLVVGTVARLDPVKNLGSLVEAIALLAPRRDACLVIIGDGPEMRSLTETAAALGVTGRVTFLGHQDDARRWLAGLDVFVNASTSEGVSLTILEAMAAGLAIVATAVGGTPEVLNESSGRLVPARNPAALSAAIGALADDPGLRATLGRAARQRVEAHFTLDRMVRQYADVYRGTLNSEL